MKNKTLLYIHFVYWAGIIIDLLEALKGMTGFYKAVYLGQADSVALVQGGGKIVLAWTLLLIWADRKPIERRAVLLFTAIIIILATLNGYLMVLSGLAEFQGALINTIGSPILGIMYIVAYIAANKMARADK
jgi:hypothetical protein